MKGFLNAFLRTLFPSTESSRSNSSWARLVQVLPTGESPPSVQAPLPPGKIQPVRSPVLAHYQPRDGKAIGNMAAVSSRLPGSAEHTPGGPGAVGVGGGGRWEFTTRDRHLGPSLCLPKRLISTPSPRTWSIPESHSGASEVIQHLLEIPLCKASALPSRNSQSRRTDTQPTQRPV